MSFRVYLVEDETNLNRLLATYLEREGWTVKAFETGRAAREAIAESPHLWILDIMLPDIDGFRLFGDIRTATPQVPIIFISARDADLDRVLGLEMGGDDYIAKPFLPRELVIRARNLLQRTYGRPREHDTPVLRLGAFEIDPGRRRVTIDGRPVELTAKEFDLLALLAGRPGQAFSRDDILKNVWGADYFGSDRVVDDLVRRLRRKLPGLRVETIYGYGYRLVKP
ncbi:MAG: DNA-binding response regulator [Candidatus Reconcilbacillus cellulovorans]|mgnify:CR=1 FL=1|uniref:DNA-binding response regulator n=1 Tax=Candidatus Reconcilbacillus cellulovorans TaxID=1906605 RepID=A0A2A6DZI9_9BACL|nr:MAG: DNA-binding response regulator [Candidatus Reconcilbacillus cellulovorans]